MAQVLLCVILLDCAGHRLGAVMAHENESPWAGPPPPRRSLLNIIT